MPWWALSTCNMGNRALYCRLSRASIAGLHCAGLVSSVTNTLVCFAAFFMNSSTVVRQIKMILMASYPNCRVPGIWQKSSWRKFLRTRYGRIMGSLLKSWCILNILFRENKYLPIFSRSRMISNVPTFMNSSPLTYSIRSSKEPSRTTWSHG